MRRCLAAVAGRGAAQQLDATQQRGDGVADERRDVGRGDAQRVGDERRDVGRGGSGGDGRTRPPATASAMYPVTVRFPHPTRLLIMDMRERSRKRVRHRIGQATPPCFWSWY